MDQLTNDLHNLADSLQTLHADFQRTATGNPEQEGPLYLLGLLSEKAQEIAEKTIDMDNGPQ